MSPPMHKDDAINDVSISDNTLFNGVFSFLNTSRAGDSQPIALPQQNEIVLTEISINFDLKNGSFIAHLV